MMGPLRIEEVDFLLQHPLFGKYRKLMDQALRLVVPTLEDLLKTTPMVITI